MTTFDGAWHALVDYLSVSGADVLFTLPGDDLTVLRAAERYGVRAVLARDQRAAVFMATGFALQTGRPTVAAIGKGPAVTNAVTGLLEARCSGAPLVLVAGATGADSRGSGAFQELDQLPLVAPLVKWSHRVDDPSRVVPAIIRAFQVAAAHPQGPVYLELPDHLNHARIDRNGAWPEEPIVATGAVVAEPRLLREARRPVLLLGGGMRHAPDRAALGELATRLSAAVFVTASGRGSIDEDHPGFCGLAGLYAPEAARRLWHDADAVFAFGTRLEETATYPAGFVREGVPVVQVNLDPLGWSAEVPGPRVLGEGSAVARQWLDALRRTEAEESAEPARDAWRDQVTACRDEVHQAARAELARMARSPHIHVAEVLAALAEAAPPDRILVQENGLQDMWSYFYPYWSCSGGSGSIVPSEQTSLGFGAAAAAGVALAAPGRLVAALVGDGAFAVAHGELRGLADAGIGVLYLVLRNGGYGWLANQWQPVASRNSRYRFVDPTAGICVPPDDRVWRTTAHAKPELGKALGEALDVVASGRPAVVEIVVSLSDVPPGIADLEGDFPGGVGGAAGASAAHQPSSE